MEVKSIKTSVRSDAEESYSREDDDSVEEGEGTNMYLSLWIPAILLFGFGDTLLSTMVFSSGGYEANPLMAFLVSMFGGSMIAFVLVKTVVLVALAFLSFKILKHSGWLIPGLLTVAGAYLVFANLMTYLNM